VYNKYTKFRDLPEDREKWNKKYLKMRYFVQFYYSFYGRPAPCAAAGTSANSYDRPRRVEHLPSGEGIEMQPISSSSKGKGKSEPEVSEQKKAAEARRIRQVHEDLPRIEFVSRRTSAPATPDPQSADASVGSRSARNRGRQHRRTTTASEDDDSCNGSCCVIM
jgi:hypothetical protein